MNYFFSCSVLPHKRDLLERIESAAERLSQNLQRLSIRDLEISDYTKKYLMGYIENITSTLQINSYILAWLLSDCEASLEAYALVDYGGGCGILSLLAKEIGIGTVIYNDIYDVSCHDARVIGLALEKQADGYVCGDMNDLLCYLNDQQLSIDAIASYDVIEHIYDIEGYFRKLYLLPSRKLNIAFASSANPLNPLIEMLRRKTHRKIECDNREWMWGHKERDSLRSYLDLRKEIIVLYADDLSPLEIDSLAHITRGLVKEDIERCVLEYKNSGVITYRPKHPTNTCDPYTGNWAENLMDLATIKNIFSSEGFLVDIKCGYYGFSKKPLIRFVKSTLNWFISLLRLNGLYIAPFYMVCAQSGLQKKVHQSIADKVIPEV